MLGTGYGAVERKVGVLCSPVTLGANDTLSESGSVI